MIKFPNKKYNIIYADPPWQFKYQSKKRTEGTSVDENIRDPQKEYSCMNIQDIYDLPVQDIADDNCVLMLWVTYPLLKEGLKTIEEWGFEICLLATKGKPKRVSKSVHQIIYEPISKHSKKPYIVRDKIVELCGDLPRIELFARTGDDMFTKDNFVGWDVWGNEVSDLN